MKRVVVEKKEKRSLSLSSRPFVFGLRRHALSCIAGLRRSAGGGGASCVSRNGKNRFFRSTFRKMLSRDWLLG
jgi:hypothetical protein